MNPSFTNVVFKFRGQLANNEVVTDDSILAKSVQIMSGIEGELPVALLHPSSVKGISAAVKICAQAGQSIVPQGGLSGLTGGAVPTNTDIVLSLERFSGVKSINATAETMTVRAETIRKTKLQNSIYLFLSILAHGEVRLSGGYDCGKCRCHSGFATWHEAR